MNQVSVFLVDVLEMAESTGRMETSQSRNALYLCTWVICRRWLTRGALCCRSSCHNVAWRRCLVSSLECCVTDNLVMMMTLWHVIDLDHRDGHRLYQGPLCATPSPHVDHHTTFHVHELNHASVSHRF